MICCVWSGVRIQKCLRNVSVVQNNALYNVAIVGQKTDLDQGSVLDETVASCNVTVLSRTVLQRGLALRLFDDHMLDFMYLRAATLD